MGLANPILLWSLLGLSVPIAIHLLSRKEGQVIKLGSIRHVQETSTQQFKGIKLNEFLLLALRCALIFVFCLMLSEMRCSWVSKQKWVAVETGLEKYPLVRSIVDSLEKDGYQPHQLRDGFPSIGDDSISRLNYWALVEQLHEKNLSEAVVVSSSRLENFRGKRISLPSNIKWLEVPVDTNDFPVEAVSISSDSLYVRKGHSRADQTFFTTEKMKSTSESVSISTPNRIRIAVVADDKHSYDRRIVLASLMAIKKSFPIEMEMLQSTLRDPLPQNYDWVIWLADSTPSEKISSPTIAMRSSGSTNLLTQIGNREWCLTKRLNEEVALDQNLTVELARLIIPSIKQEKIVRTNDRRTIPDTMAWSSEIQLASAGSTASDANRFLILCLIALLLSERIIAYRRNQ